MEKKKNNFVENNKKQILVIVLALILLLGGTYAWLQLTLTGTQKTRIEAGTLALTLEEGVEINVEEALPMSDEDGLKLTPYTFTLTNTGDITSEYTIYLDDVAIPSNDIMMEDNVVKYSLTKNETTNIALISTLKNDNNRVLETGTMAPNATTTYDLRLWIDENASNNDIHVLNEDGEYIKGKVFSVKLRIEASQIKE